MTKAIYDATRAADASIRVATMDDALPVCVFLNKLGLASSPIDLKSAHRLWTRYWIDNPACKVAGSAFPIGWILEHEGRPVGYFGNIPIQYRIAGRDLLAGVATSWGVEKSFRSRTGDVAREYFTQPGVDLLLITTAILPAGRVCIRFGSERLPIGEYDRVLFWVLDSASFLTAAFRKKQISPSLATAFAYSAAPLLAAANSIQRRVPGRQHGGLHADVVTLDAVDEHFTDLWRAKADDGRLFAYRRDSELRWHFAPQAQRGELFVVRCTRGGKLMGYLVLACDRAGSLALSRAKVLDLFVVEDNTDAIDVLFSAAWELARDQGCHLLEVTGLTSPIRTHLRKYRPFSRRFPAFPFFYKAMSPELASDLANPARWHPTLYDGDGSL